MKKTLDNLPILCYNVYIKERETSPPLKGDLTMIIIITARAALNDYYTDLAEEAAEQADRELQIARAQAEWESDHAFLMSLAAMGDYDTYSDVYKDMNGFRPHYSPERWAWEQKYARAWLAGDIG